MNLRRWLGLILIFSCLFPLPGRANINRLFSATFFDHMVYQAGICGENILRFTHQLHQAGLTQNDQYVLYLIYQSSSIDLENAPNDLYRAPLFPKSARAFQKTWHYHVVLSSNGLIFDYDFTDAPSPIAIAEYFEQMFTNQYIFLRAIPIDDYLAAEYPRPFTKTIRYYDYINDPEDRYPLTEVHEYLESLGNRR